MIYPGQSFFYDFILNQDIYPEYEQFPYEISFAEGYEQPAWLHLENNKLSADLVPDITEKLITIKLEIKNRPGGKSKVIQLLLMVMN